MHVPAALKTIVFLCALPIPTLGALTTEQITVELQDLEASINDVISYAKGFTIANADVDADKLVSNINTIFTAISSFNSEIAGIAELTQSEQVEVVEAIEPFGDSLTTLFNTLDSKVGDFLLPEDRTDVDTAADELDNAADETIELLDALGPTIAEAGEAAAANFDDARDNLDEDTEDSNLKKKFRFRRH